MKSRAAVDIDDSHLDEVTFINGYAVFMGYLLMGVRALAVLVVTWSTAVLLGGYADDLSSKDFFSVTFITLIQLTAGIFDFLLTEKLRDVIQSGWGLLAAVGSMIKQTNEIEKPDKELSNAGWALVYFVSAVQLLVFAFLLCPLALLYMLGFYVSTAIALWRLIEHDFGEKHMKTALEALYSLAVAQGILFGYRAIYAYGAKSRIAKEVGHWYQLDEEIVLDYLNETVRGCEKDPSFATGRNFVTYAVDQITESKSHRGYLSGVLILGALLQPKLSWYGYPGMMKQLLTGYASFSHVVQRLLKTFGPTSPYKPKIREHAARIVLLVAGSIHLDQFPGWTIHCISSLLDTYEEYSWRPEGIEPHNGVDKECDRYWLLGEFDRHYLQIDGFPKQNSTDSNTLYDFNSLVVVGLKILQKLAREEDNCRVISSTDGLVLKTMASLTSETFHRDHHQEWLRIAMESLQLLSRLLAAPGETGKKLRHQISSNDRGLVSTTESILKCDQCCEQMKPLTVGILLDLSVDTSSIEASGSTGAAFICALATLFLSATETSRLHYSSVHWMKKRSYIRCLAGQKLLAIITVQSKTNATVILQSVVPYVASLFKTIVEAGNDTYRLHAAQIVDHICLHYAMDDEYRKKKLKEVIAEVMPKMLQEIIRCGSTGQEIQEVTEATSKATYSAPDADVEKGRASQDNGQKDRESSSHQRYRELHEDSKLQQALISLCSTIGNRWMKADPDMTHQLDEIAAKVCSEQGKPVKTFNELVEEAQAIMKKKA